MAQGDRTPTTDWLHPPGEQQGLRRYLQTLRERIWLIVLAVAITTGVAIVYVATTESTYEAEADVLVNPVPGDSETLVSLGLIRESVDPIRDVETAARLITNIDVAKKVKQDLGTTESPESLLANVSAQPVSESNIVAVTGSAPTGTRAAEIANGFAEAAVEERTDRLHEAIDVQIPTLEAQLESSGGKALAEQITQLEILRQGDDPTLQLETRATVPDSAVAPRPVLSIIGGVLAGLVLGIGAAFGFQVLDPRFRREEQLRAAFRLPILARVPRQKKTEGDRPVTPDGLTAGGIEAYRTLRATLAASRSARAGSRAALITSPSASEGKTTSAVNLATSLALAGRQVILIEADLRRPEIGKAIGVSTDRGVVSVLIEESSLADALVTSPKYGPNLRLLLAERAGVGIAELFSLPAAQELITQAKLLADYVVIDSSPLTEVVDALPLTRTVDDIVIVVQLGKSRLNKIAELAELLAENGVKPAGFVVLGVPPPAGGYYHYHRDEMVQESSRRATEPARK